MIFKNISKCDDCPCFDKGDLHLDDYGKCQLFGHEIRDEREIHELCDLLKAPYEITIQLNKT
jgi:hypothetical protein